MAIILIGDVGSSQTGILINGVDLRYYFDNPISFTVPKKLLLIAKKNGQSFYTAPANTNIGTVYSYFYGGDGTLYLMINPDIFNPTGTVFADGSGTKQDGYFFVDASNVTQQSTATAKGDLATQQKKDEENKSTTDKLIEAGKKVALVGGGVWLGWNIFKYIFQHKKNN